MSSARALLERLLAPHLALAPGDFDGLAAALEPVELEAGTVLHRHGRVCRRALMLGDGIVRAYYVHEGREVNLRLLCAPAVATAMASVITGAPADEWLAAVTPVRGYWLELSRLAAGVPALVGERLRRILAEQHYLALERRLRMLQWKSGRERYAFFCAHMEAQIVARTPGIHVASYLGIAPETLSRLRRR